MDENSENNLQEGVRIVTLSAWDEFHQEILSLKSRRGFVWRGQKKDEDNSWFLHASFDRKVRSKNQHDRVEKLKRHLDKFKAEMNKSYPNVLPQDEVEIWALGQHYGLKTPLLDWTLSPYIAAYFAFIERNDPNDQNDRYRYVYALNRSLERLLSKRKKASEILSKERSVIFIDKMPHPNPRFTAQEGILTKTFHGKDIGNYVQIFSKKRPKEKVIVKFRIPTKDRKKCLHALHLMNINYMSLMLDLRGVVDYCNSKLEGNRENE